MKKLIISFIMILSIITIITSCTSGSFLTVGYAENSTSTKWTASYMKFDGHKQRDINFKDTDEHIIIVSATTESGTLRLNITDKNDNEYYDGLISELTDFTVTVVGHEKYIIKLEADNHKGSFDITWE